MHRSVPLLLTASVSMSAATHPPETVERALRARVSTFYKLVVAHRFREAEALISPASREAWYTLEKPAIKDFRIQGTAWSDGFKRADVSLISTSRLRRPRIGEFDVKIPFSSHWVLENGAWMWYVPKVDVRQTPFGTMRMDHAQAAQSGVDLHQMIASGPSATAVSQALQADRASVKLGVAGATQQILLKNTLTAPLKLSVKLLSGSGFDAVLPVSDLAAGSKTELSVIRKPREPFQAGKLAIIVNPTSQVLVIGVE